MKMDMGDSDDSMDAIRAKESQLKRMHELQARLGSAWEREVGEQKEKDAQAHELMERDPSGHIEMMKMEQEHSKLALELPRMLLKREAEVHEELLQAQKRAVAKQPETSKMMGKMIPMERWSQVPLLALGLWLIFSPFTAGYDSVPLMLNDVISGILIMTLAGIVLRTRRSWAGWANAVVGMWVAFAPVVFWAPNPATYMNDTLVGVLVFTFAVLIPMKMKMHGSEVPRGWSYNPSSWIQRAPVIALGLVSFLLTQYMASYQLGHIEWAYDPLFGDDTVTVLTSSVSKAFPVSDAGWGAWIYLVETLSAFMGDPRRWRTMPWMVSIFGFLVVPLGGVSVLFVIFQPVIVGAWCTICLITAVLMVLMIALSLDEILAMIQYLRQARRAGKSLWHTFWRGGDAFPDNKVTPQRSSNQTHKEMFWGVTVPWNLIAVAGLGVWLMAAPAIFQAQAPASNIDFIIGPLVWVVAITSLAEVARAVRFVNIVLAAALMALPWMVGGGTLEYGLNNILVGALVIAFSIRAGKIRNTFGSWNRIIV